MFASSPHRCWMGTEINYGVGWGDLTQQQPGQGVQVSHVRVVTEDAVDALLVVREDVIQFSFKLGCLPWRPLGGRGQGR